MGNSAQKPVKVKGDAKGTSLLKNNTPRKDIKVKSKKEISSQLKEMIDKLIPYATIMQMQDKGDEVIVFTHDSDSGCSFQLYVIVGSVRVDITIIFKLIKKSPHLLNNDSLQKYFRSRTKLEAHIQSIAQQKSSAVVAMIDRKDLEELKSEMSKLIESCLDLDV